jgi:hypothetical protein
MQRLLLSGVCWVARWETQLARKYWIYLSAIIGLAVIATALAFNWGYSTGIRESLRISARSDVLQNLNIARHLHENAHRDALSGVDARINLSVMEISQLSSKASQGEKAEDSKVLAAVAKFRQKFPDTSGETGLSPSSDHVRDVLAPYAK